MTTAKRKTQKTEKTPTRKTGTRKKLSSETSTHKVEVVQDSEEIAPIDQAISAGIEFRQDPKKPTRFVVGGWVAIDVEAAARLVFKEVFGKR